MSGLYDDLKNKLESGMTLTAESVSKMMGSTLQTGQTLLMKLIQDMVVSKSILGNYYVATRDVKTRTYKVTVEIVSRKIKEAPEGRLLMFYWKSQIPCMGRVINGNIAGEGSRSICHADYDHWSEIPRVR